MTFLVIVCLWHPHYLMHMESRMALLHSIGQDYWNKVQCDFFGHVTPSMLALASHDANGVIIAPLHFSAQGNWIEMHCDFLVMWCHWPKYATYANKNMCRYQATTSVYIPYTNSLQSTPSLPALVYLHFTLLAYPLNIYACYTRHVCPTAIVIKSTCRPHITAHINKTKQWTTI